MALIGERRILKIDGLFISEGKKVDRVDGITQKKGGLFSLDLETFKLV